ncbi:MAG: Rid family hydrolase [Pseudoflavonifractor sp.]|nr:Rid family hydrolase [Alloprevotella sp.]MCM1116897.1 Rid family hydrolase [Pseudoflavonifractor sp.]
MEYSIKYKYADTQATVALSLFKDGSPEAHAIISLSSAAGLNSQAQIDEIKKATAKLCSALGCEYRLRPVLARWLLSDAANQAPLVGDCLGDTAVAIVEQQPLNATKVAIWIYFMEATEVSSAEAGLTLARRPSYTHIFMASAGLPGFGSQTATAALLEDYNIRLNDLGTSLADGCLRTWFFVRDVDHFYRGVVCGRNEVFAVTGLTPQTHFIASTGIGGGAENPDVTVKMDAWAALGIKPSQITYIQAPDYLNPTYQYGVAFERATAIDYGDRRHMLVSGTASIDNHGDIVCPGDIIGQTKRMLDNVEALLREGKMAWDNVAHMIIYLRDIADYNTVKDIFDERFPLQSSAPRVIVHAPVCRPGWLIEMECMAIKKAPNPDYAPF